MDAFFSTNISVSEIDVPVIIDEDSSSTGSKPPVYCVIA